MSATRRPLFSFYGFAFSRGPAVLTFDSILVAVFAFFCDFTPQLVTSKTVVYF